MTIVEHINHGFDGVKRSFKLVWQNKILVMYVILGIALTTLLKMSLHFIATCIFDPDVKYGLAISYPFVLAIAIFIFALFIFVEVSCTYHVLALINQQQASLRASIKAAWSKIIYIIALACITQALFFVAQLSFSRYLVFANAALIQFFGFYLIPSMATNNNSFIAMFQRSIRYACATWVEIIVGCLILLPLADLPTIAQYIPIFHNFEDNMVFYHFVTIPLSIPILIFAKTVLISYKTIMYVDTYKQRESILPFTQVP